MTEEEDLSPEELDADADAPALSSALARITAEAKTAFVPPADHDWSSVEQRLMMRFELEGAIARRSRRMQIVVGLASSLALAAGAFFLLRPVDPVPEVEPTRLLASVLKGGPKGAVLRSAVTDGENLYEGDAVEVADAPLVFVLPADGPTLATPRRAIWLVDPAGETSGRAVISRATSSTLVVSLERGAIEADVTPVRSGEAFAVDVRGATATTRVAVHGTHLRVARRGDHVTVDLTEGVIAIGAPGPGLTTGLEVRAPAHVELDVGAAPDTVRVTTGAGAVRAAWALDAVAGGQLPVPPASAQVPATPSASVAPPRDPRDLRDPRDSRKVVPAPSAEPPPVPLLSESSATSAIQVDLKRCVAQVAAAGAVKVTIDSSLSVEVRADGTVAGTKFTPPLAPAVQECASAAIFARKIEGPRTLTIPVKFEL